MLDIAVAGGITEIAATPHYRGRWKNWDLVRQNYEELLPEAEKRGVALTLGAEFYCEEFDRDHIDRYVKELSLNGGHEILFELGWFSQVSEIEDSIYMLQRAGLSVLIPHPERNRQIQRSRRVAQRYLDICCEFVLSSSSLALAPLSVIRRAAMRECKRGNYAFVASDAHSPQEYEQHIQILTSHSFLEYNLRKE